MSFTALISPHHFVTPLCNYASELQKQRTGLSPIQPKTDLSDVEVQNGCAIYASSARLLKIILFEAGAS